MYLSVLFSCSHETHSENIFFVSLIKYFNILYFLCQCPHHYHFLSFSFNCGCPKSVLQSIRQILFDILWQIYIYTFNNVAR